MNETVEEIRHVIVPTYINGEHKFPGDKVNCELHLCRGVEMNRNDTDRGCHGNRCGA